MNTAGLLKDTVKQEHTMFDDIAASIYRRLSKILKIVPKFYKGLLYKVNF